MVGTRRASVRGLALAHHLAGQLVARGWTVVSGLALGIDAACHRGAVEAGGRSVAVMATGVDRTYPWQNRGLRQEIDRLGCCLSEFPAGTGPRKFHFPRRNRLIAGLSTAVIVVEAPRRSGALLTAEFALDYNREVFAVPGPVDLDASRGCHHLLREGAHLLETVADVDQVLGCPGSGPDGSADRSGPRPAPGSPARWIFDRLDLEGTRRDALRVRWPGTDQAWAQGLLALELAGLIIRLPGGRLARKVWRGD